MSECLIRLLGWQLRWDSQIVSLREGTKSKTIVMAHAGNKLLNDLDYHGFGRL